jgi:hypothetical protein
VNARDGDLREQGNARHAGRERDLSWRPPSAQRDAIMLLADYVLARDR